LQKSLTSHIQLSYNIAACDDLCEFIHNVYINEIYRHGVIFLYLSVADSMALSAFTVKQQASETTDLLCKILSKWYTMPV